jgi:hypothetical protein
MVGPALALLMQHKQQVGSADQTIHVHVTSLYAGPKLDADALRSIAQSA